MLSVIYLGWGRTTNEGDLPDVLQEVEVTVKDNEACKTFWGSGKDDVTKNMICTKIEDGKGICQVIYFKSKSILF